MTEWSKLVRQKKARGSLSREENLALDEARGAERCRKFHSLSPSGRAERALRDLISPTRDFVSAVLDKLALARGGK